MRKTWSDFLKHMRWTPTYVWQVPDDYLVQEWHLFMTYAKHKVYY